MLNFEIDIINLVPLLFAMLATGVIAGLMAGLLGVGGGIVIVPVLFYILGYLEVDQDIKMHIAVGTSLMTIIATSISSAYSHFKRGNLDIDLIKSWSVAIFLGVIIGAGLAGLMRGYFLTTIFAVLALFVSANMALKPDGWSSSANKLPSGFLKYAIAMFIGAVSALAGIGGGTFSVPVLSACGYNIRRAVGTASAIGLLIAVPGAAGFIITGIGIEGRPIGSIGYVNIIGFLLIVPATILSAPIGVRLANVISPKLLKKIFALFLFFTSMRMIYSLIF